MSAELTHEQAADEIEAVALGIAAEDVTQAVRIHAARCPECAAELRSFYNVVTSLATLIPARQLNRGHSAGIKSRLLAKAGAGQDAIGARRQSRAEPLRAPEPRSAARPAERAPAARPARIESGAARETGDRSSMPIWIAVGATLIALGSLAAFLNARGDGAGAQSGVEAEPGTVEDRVSQLEQAVTEKDATIASLSGPGVRIVSLYNREAREALGRMFWDRGANRWSLFIYTLRQPRPGKTFRIWLGTDDGRVSLGNFEPAADGTAAFVAEHALRAGALNTVSISEEDAGSSVSGPTGPVVLAGSLR